jgi:hypothetical protein
VNTVLKFWCNKLRRISRIVEGLLASQERLYSGVIWYDPLNKRQYFPEGQQKLFICNGVAVFSARGVLNV